MDLAADAPIADLAERLDLGVSAYVAGPRLTYDVLEPDVRRLLHSVATHCATRGLHAYVQLPSRSLRLELADVGRCVKSIEGKRPRFRVLITDEARQTVENIAIELWTESDRALRSRSEDAPIRLMLGGQPPPTGEPLRTDSGASMPIDVVYTWVDSGDEGWRELAAPYMDLDSVDSDRYSQADELRYSLRSLDVFAPWVNHVYVLSNCAPPDWFEASPRFTWVDHEEVIEPELRPLFNSGAIDTFLHRVPGLGEHFLYLNDDFMLWDSVTPASFFTWDGRTIAHLATNSSVLYLQQVVEGGDGTPSQHSRVNAAHLLQQRIGVYPTRLHGHVPYALRRSVMEQIEAEFPDEIAATRRSRMRGRGDVSFVALLYHYYADATGSGLLRDAPQSLVTRNNYRRQRIRSALRTTPFLCIQDSRGSATDHDYQAFKRTTLETALPLPSTAEIVAPGSAGPR